MFKNKFFGLLALFTVFGFSTSGKVKNESNANIKFQLDTSYSFSNGDEILIVGLSDAGQGNDRYAMNKEENTDIMGGTITGRGATQVYPDSNDIIEVPDGSNTIWKVEVVNNKNYIYQVVNSTKNYVQNSTSLHLSLTTTFSDASYYSYDGSNKLLLDSKTSYYLSPCLGNNMYGFISFYTNPGVPTFIYKKVTYQVTFDNQGHGTAPSTQTVNAGWKVTKPTDPTETGQTFGGWYKESGCINEWDFDTDTVEEATTLYAKWSNAQYTINYYDKGGKTFSGTHESGAPTKHTYGTATTLKSATKTNHTFEGWYKESDCSGTKVTSLGATEYTSGSISLYAKWTADVTGPTMTSIGGYIKSDSNNKQQIVAFGATFADYAKLNEGDTCGIYVYSDSSGTVAQNFSTTDIATVKAKEGRYYCVYNVSGGATYYAKGYVIISGTTIYSDLVSASGNDTTEYTI